MGAALCQPYGDEKKDRPMTFASRQLTTAERNYSITERECLAMVFSVQKFRHYLFLNPVVFFVDHLTLKYLVSKPNLSRRLARWVLLLEEFDYTVEYKPGRMHKQADHLSRISDKLGTEDIDNVLPDANLFLVSADPEWYGHIAEFLSTQKMPPELGKVERQKVRTNSR